MLAVYVASRPYCCRTITAFVTHSLPLKVERILLQTFLLQFKAVSGCRLFWVFGFEAAGVAGVLSLFLFAPALLLQANRLL